MDDCPEGLKQTHTKETLLTGVNGHFIKLKSGIYTSGQGGSKGQGLLPSGAGEGEYRPRCLRQNQLGGARRVEPTARTLITGGITITKRAKFFLSYPLKPVLVQNL